MKTVVALVAFLAIFVPLNSAFGGHLHGVTWMQSWDLGCFRRKEHVQTMWGCSKDTIGCDALSVAVSAKIDAAVKCECTFSAKGVPYGNKDFPFSTMTTQKPTTLATTKKTTTTEKPTTKTTTTTEKPMTKTTMTTLKDPMPVSGQPMMATTADVNRSARRSVAIFWTLLVAIGILA
uniref:Uncharacterized protein n=1 Tax=Globodera rostochiensis TaxID=31243 RepID=A0A914HSE4_GLORO